MAEERLLTDGMPTGWRNAASDIISHDLDLERQSSFWGGVLADQLVEDFVTVEELEGGMAWTNALHAAAEERMNGRPSEELGPDDQIEVMAISLARSAGQIALDQAGSEEKLQQLRRANHPRGRKHRTDRA